MARKNNFAKALLQTSRKMNEVRELKLLESATLLFMTAIALALRDKLGFGKKRMEEILIEVCRNIKCINDGTCTLDDMIQTITKETGLDIREILSRGLEDRPLLKLLEPEEKENVSDR